MKSEGRNESDFLEEQRGQRSRTLMSRREGASRDWRDEQGSDHGEP